MSETTKSVTDAVDRAIAEFGKIDILFNNAGICAYATVDKMTDEEWDVIDRYQPQRSVYSYPQSRSPHDGGKERRYHQ